MKQYNKYMDSVRVSDTLHQRLVNLEAGGKRPVPWKKYGALAAALALVAGLGGWGLKAGFPWGGYYEPLVDRAPESATDGQPDIALADPDVAEPGEKTLGGYEVTSEGGPDTMVTHYTLPYIEYGTVEAVQGKIALDWALGEGFTEGPVSQEEIETLLGGADVLSGHLDWGGYELFGWRYDRADGTPGLIMISGHKGELDHFVFSLMYGELPPTCIAYEDSVTQEVRGLTVTADKYDGEQGCDRRVSFMKDDWGYRFDVTATDANQAELLASRLVRLAADDGLDTAALTGVEMCWPTEDGGDYSVGEPNYEDGSGETSAYDPKEAADPSYNAPATVTCPDCGATYPAGSEHDCAMCDGYPIAHFCEVCGETYPEGAVHSCHGAASNTMSPDSYVCEICGEICPKGVEHAHEACGYPQAPDTYVCEVCGQTCQAGQAHGCGQGQGNHHQEGHHGGHH